MRYATLLAILVVCCVALSPAVAADGVGVFDSDGVKIRYVTEGTGVPVVLIHGWMADSGMWGRDPSGNTKLNAAGLDGFQLIALDCRGHGKSDKPHDPAAYGPAMAADVVRLLDHLKIDKAHLVGYSMGAFIAGHVAANHPERVLGVVYGGQVPIIAADVKPTHFAEVDVFAKAVEEGNLASYVMAVMPPSRPKPTEEQANAIAKFMFNGKDVTALAAAGRSFKELAVSGERLKACAAPVLFIHGGNESEHVKTRVASVRELLGRGELKIIEGADHITTLVNPAFGAAIIEFLRAAGSQDTPATRPAAAPRDGGA